MSIQYPKKERGGPTIAGYEVPHIYKDPPAARFTKKKERVNIADVMYMVQADNPFGDATRINDGINYFARGVNNMVEVDYGGHGAGSQNTSMSQPQAGAQFKVEVVRPPMYPIETLVALSRPHIHQNYSIATNPTNFPQINSENFYDKNMVKNATRTDIISGVIKSTPTLSQYLEFGPVIDQYGVQNKITTDKLTGILYSTPNLQFIDAADDASRPRNVDKNKIKDTLLKELRTNFSTITIYDPTSNSAIDVSANVRDKNYIAVTAAKGLPIIVNTNDGKKIKIKDYTYSVVKSNMNNDQLVIQVQQPDIILDRNTPLYAATTNLNDPIGYNEDLSRKGTESSYFSERYNNKLANFGKFEDRVSRPVYDQLQVPYASAIKSK